MHTRYSRWLCFVLAILLLGSCQNENTKAVNEPTESASISFNFTDITSSAGLDAFTHQTGAVGDKWFPETMGSGGAFFDYNGDKHIDLILVNGATWSNLESASALMLYENQGDGTFVDQTEAANLHRTRGYGFGISAADFDNDGDDDILFTTLEGSRLFANNQGQFSDITALAGLDDAALWTTASIFFDANRDGWLDLYIGNYVDWSPETDIFCTLDGQTKSYCTPELYEGQSGSFYVNNQDGTFRNATSSAGFANVPGKSLGVAELDFNQDGWPDLVVSNDTQPDLLFENNGDGTFTEKGQLSGIAFDENGKARAGMGIDVGIVDQSGKETVFVGNFSKEMIAVFHHMGNGLFVDKAARSRIGRPSLLNLTFGLFLFDVDLDGDLDLFAGNGHLQSEIENTQEGITYREPPHLFLNDGNGYFDDAAPLHGGVLAKPLIARGTAYADIDGDGDLDVLVTENGQGIHLWRNDLQSSYSSLRFTLTGTSSNRSALGTEVRVVAGDLDMKRRVKTGSSYLTQSELTLTFGLETQSKADTVIITWPSGLKEKLTNVDAGQTLHIVEGEATTS